MTSNSYSYSNHSSQRLVNSSSSSPTTTTTPTTSSSSSSPLSLTTTTTTEAVNDCHPNCLILNTSSSTTSSSCFNTSDFLDTSNTYGGGDEKKVSFCSIRIEIREDYPLLPDLKFSCGRRLEDCLENLTLTTMSGEDGSTPQAVPPPPPATKAQIAKRRGKRETKEIRVQTWEKKAETVEGAASSSSSSNHSSKEASPAESSSSSTSESTKLSFKSGNPYVEVTQGILHLYKENGTTSLEEGVLRSQMIAMLGVPAIVKTPELLQFTAPCHSQLEMIRIIHDGSPNQYMALFRFRSQEAADEFYQVFNGCPFNSLESDLCTLVYISKVETCKETAYYPLTGHTELPLCSICLERMDESVSTVLTILCNHTFHGSCLALWEDSTCPVCRYVQTPEVVAEQRCFECSSADDLWICLICGYVGCGRYVGGHAHAHFLATEHCYTMELGENRVWDYVGDNFVHRLVQTDSADGKLVEAQSQDPKGLGLHGSLGGIRNPDDDINSAEKMDSLQLEYTYLLTSQLESQRRYYEEKINRIAEKSSREIDEIHNRAKDSVEEKEKMQEKMTLLINEKKKNEAKLASVNSKLTKAISDLKEERQMNESLRENQNAWKKKLSDHEKKLNELQYYKDNRDVEVKELKEQIRDLMFFLEAQNKISKSPLLNELQEGQVSVPKGISSSDNNTPKTANSSSSGGARSKRKNKK